MTRVVVRTENPLQLQEMLWRSRATIYENLYIVEEGLKIVSPVSASRVLQDLESRGVCLGDCEVHQTA